jgi:hypothetical protein
MDLKSTYFIFVIIIIIIIMKILANKSGCFKMRRIIAYYHTFSQI